MAKVSDSELVLLIEEAIDRHVSLHNVGISTMGEAVAQVIVHALRRAGMTAIREERRHRADGSDALSLPPLRRPLVAA